MPDSLSTPRETEPPAHLPARPAYEVPRVNTYTDAGLLAALGPAQAGGTYTVFGGP